MKCREARLLMADAARDGLRAGNEAAAPDELVRHAAECPACREEFAALSLLLGDIARGKEPVVSDAYWNALLPSVHRRIEEREEGLRFPSWMVRYVLPASAGLVICAMLFSVPWAGKNQPQSVYSIIEQLPADEVRHLGQTDEASVLSDPAGTAVDNSESAPGDVAVIHQIIQEDGISLSPDVDVTTTLAGLTSRDSDDIAALLERQDGNK